MFDAKAFEKARFEPRTRDVRVPSLAAFFSEGSEPVFTVRGLSGQELGQVEAELASAKSYDDLIAALAERKGKEIAAQLKEQLGLGEEVPKQTARAIFTLIMGIVEPKMDRAAVVKLCTFFPADFYDLYNKVKDLSGQGAIVEKPQPSGRTTESAQPAVSETPEGDSCSSSGPTCSPTGT